MHVAVTGSSGLVGSALDAFLSENGHRVTRVVRSQPKPGAGAVRWDPSTGFIEPRGLDEVDAIVHLAGENIASGRWSARKKADIRGSRVISTRRLCESLAQHATPPQTLVCASAIGYYGHRGDERLTEESPSGSGFLAEVCREWERAAEPVLQRGVRVVHLRFGVVLSSRGGALAKLLPPFRLGLGGPLGGGTQQMAWLALDDVLGIIQHVLRSASVRGPVNAVSPNPVTNREFARVLGLVLRRPAVMPAPAFALKLLLGQMAEETLLASAKAVPARLLASGYAFRYPELEGALRHLLGR
ncbi:MAG: TIGR01777 family protein [Omnitrophica WOR_2 bacterium RIFCSPLOWO2_12_FULL_63_16]|nr:MAG: TIGR01777 family protein [Omnitrophica WOR_2 bacterium RIFCSPLOWO2_12_FULL_63_16]